MILKEIKNKEIELYVENEIDRYKRLTSIKPIELVETYLNSDGFIVFVDNKNKFIGYLEVMDIQKISNILNHQNVGLYKDVNELITQQKIKLKEDYIDFSESLINVLNKLNDSPQIFFPVLKNGHLIGRVSKDMLKKRINKIYSTNNISF